MTIYQGRKYFYLHPSKIATYRFFIICQGFFKKFDFWAIFLQKTEKISHEGTKK